jgi:UDP-N-acetylglucosamine transferase subunit ALG13
MILVTVGTHPQGFERLVKAADELAADLDEEVVIQYGSSSYVPQHARGFRWATSQEMERLTTEARVVISHAAAGAIILALHAGKPLVLVPRLKQYNELLDDHQQIHAAALSAQDRAVTIMAPTAESLLAAIQAAHRCQPPTGLANQLISALRQTLADWQPK